VLVATSALGMGMDIPDIRLIVHVDESRNMLDYAQGTGRAGRDGLAGHLLPQLLAPNLSENLPKSPVYAHP
jgi:superfamily II DNA helicase RecQ